MVDEAARYTRLVTARMPPNIMLMGPRASGKTTVGKSLAGKLSYAFVDLDDRTAARLGERRAGDALAKHGEPAFREAEAAALTEVLGASGQVIALGGGTPMGLAARALLADAKLRGPDHVAIFYLRVDSRTLKLRLATDPTPRPSLTGRGVIDEVDEILAVRDPVYHALAHHTLDASGSPPTVADRVIALTARP